MSKENWLFVMRIMQITHTCVCGPNADIFVVKYENRYIIY